MGLALAPDKLGKPLPNLYRGNVFTRCRAAVSESASGLWAAALHEGNSLVECGGAPVER